MKFKYLMINSLTDMLEEGETLTHPIYGVLNTASAPYYAFFGLTETHLLIALVTGKKITFTKRIPLDIRSVNVKQTFLGEYNIEINFKHGSPCKISAFKKVATIDVQKENLPLFLDLLSSKEDKTEKVNNDLKNIDGKKIRWQYFNVPIYGIIAIMMMMVTMFTIHDIRDGSFYLSNIFDTIIQGLYMASPFIVLSVLNRFLFGKVLCVMNDRGIYLKNEFIEWKKIKKVVYKPELSSKREIKYTYASFTVAENSKEYELHISHFPLYGLRIIKNYNPSIKVQIPTENKLFIAIMMLIPPIIAFIITFFN